MLVVAMRNASTPPYSVLPVLAYDDVRAAVEYLTKVFGFAERVQIGDHRAQLSAGGGAVIVADATHGRRSPAAADGVTQSVMVRVEDVQAHYRAAVAADGLSAGTGGAGRLGGDADPSADPGGRASGLRVDRALPFSGASTAHFSFDMTVESFLEGHVRAFAWLGGVPRECVYDNLRSAVARRDGGRISWNPRFVQLRGHYAFHATACTPATPREKGSVEGAVRYHKTGFWPARRFESLPELDEVYADWRDRVARRAATPPAGTSSPSDSRTNVSSWGPAAGRVRRR